MVDKDYTSPKVVTLINDGEDAVKIQFYKTNSYLTLNSDTKLKMISTSSKEISYFNELASILKLKIEVEDSSTEDDSDKKDEDKDKEDTNPVDDPTIANVTTLEELIAASSNSEIKTINLNADISNITKAVTVSNGAAFNGNNHKLSFNKTKQNLVFTKDTIIEKLEVENTIEDKETWSSNYAVQVYNGTYIITDCKFHGANAGLLVNSSIASINGTINVSDNGFGGIEVSKGKNGKSDPELTVMCTLVNTTEAYKKPTIWIDGDVGNVTVDNMTEVEINEQKQYYLVESNSIEIV